MGRSRSQISQQLVALLAAATKTGGGLLFAAGSCFEGALPVENFVASNLTMPIAVVQTFEGPQDPDVPGRLDDQRFVIGVCGGAVSEEMISSNLASGGTASSQHLLENTIRDLLVALNPAPGWAFIDATHGFQGEVLRVSGQKVVPAQGQSWVVAEVLIAAYNCTKADT